MYPRIHEVDPSQKEKYSFLSDKAFTGYTTQSLSRILDGKDEEAWLTVMQTIYETFVQMKGMNNGPKRATELHRVLSEFIEKFLTETKSSVSCTKGCSHCCRQEVVITDDEAILYAKMIKAGHSVDISRLKTQAKWAEASDWGDKAREKRECVFLKDNVCSIYEHRPLVCRKFFVKSDPKECVDIKGRSLQVSITQAETFVSAAYNLKPDGGTMAIKLLEKLGI